MNIKRITAFAAAFVLSLGVLTAVPEVSDKYSGTIISASAKEVDGFVIETDSDGKKFVSGYNGKVGDIRIPDGVEYVGVRAFDFGDAYDERTTQITSLTFPKSCTEIKGELFAGKGIGLKTVVFEGDAKIGRNAFMCCDNLEKVTVMGSIVDQIGANAFSMCYSLKTVKIKKNKFEFEIHDEAFSDCHSLTSINIPSKCTYIYNDAFQSCFKLKKVTIPANTVICSCAFGYANMYTEVSEYGSPVGNKEIFAADGKKSGYVEYFDYNAGKYKCKKFTPTPITLTVTKGSPAEKYAKDNGIKYKYAKSKTSKSEK